MLVEVISEFSWRKILEDIEKNARIRSSLP
jgi:hypothetical protein